MVGMIASEPVPAAYELLSASRSLLWLSLHGRRWRLPNGRGPHDDGWGLAWRQDGKPIVKSLADPADENTIIVEQSEDPAESLFGDD